MFFIVLFVLKVCIPEYLMLTSFVGLPIDEEDSETGKEREIPIDGQSNMEEKELPSADFPACILKSKSVFKCRICPRIVCLNEETLRAHLKSKVRS